MIDILLPGVDDAEMRELKSLLAKTDSASTEEKQLVLVRRLLWNAGFRGLSLREDLRICTKMEEAFRSLQSARTEAIKYAAYKWYRDLKIFDISIFVDAQDDSVLIDIYGKAYLYDLNSEISPEEERLFLAGERGVCHDVICWD